MTEVEQSQPRIITPEEAQRGIGRSRDLAYTVATELDRTRAAVVKALRDAWREYKDIDGVLDRADQIESGADW